MLWIAAVVFLFAWSAQAVLSVLQVRKFVRHLKKPRRDAFDNYRPPAAVIVPVKGIEANLEANLRSLVCQDYPSYRLVFVVESKSDPAYDLIAGTLDQSAGPKIDIVISGRAPRSQGRKTHNQIAAIKFLDQTDNQTEVLAFADTDAVPGPQWLADLVGPLQQKQKTAVTTGYRWLIPEHDTHGRISFTSHLASIINSSIACFCGHDRWNHAWGGSMAIRRETANRGELISYWTGAISDDYQITRMCRVLGMRIYFVPACLVASPASFSCRSLLEFGRRQYIITRVHAPKLYLAALLLHLLYVTGFIVAWLMLILGLITSPGDPAWLYGLAAIVVVFLCNQWRAAYRREAIRVAFGHERVNQMNRTLQIERWLTVLYMAAHLAIILIACRGRRFRWRETEYELHAARRVKQVLSD